MFKRMGGGVNGFLNNVKKTALFSHDGFPKRRRTISLGIYLAGIFMSSYKIVMKQLHYPKVFCQPYQEFMMSDLHVNVLRNLA